MKMSRDRNFLILTCYEQIATGSLPNLFFNTFN
jgi:hypothetical protein